MGNSQSPLSSAVETLLAPLDKVEREVVQLRFFNEAGIPATLDEVAAALGLSVERVREIEEGAMAKLE